MLSVSNDKLLTFVLVSQHVSDRTHRMNIDQPDALLYTSTPCFLIRSINAQPQSVSGFFKLCTMSVSVMQAHTQASVSYVNVKEQGQQQRTFPPFPLQPSPRGTHGRWEGSIN